MPGSGIGKNRPRRTTEHYLSGETSNTIPAGTPVCFVMSGVTDGALVELPASADSVAIGTQLLAGVAVRDIAPATAGEFVVNGYVAELRVIRGVRAASTDSYASSPAIAIGDHLNLHANNGVSRATAAASGALHPFVALQSAASSASAASTTSDTSLVRVDKLKAFVRLM